MESCGGLITRLGERVGQIESRLNKPAQDSILPHTVAL